MLFLFHSSEDLDYDVIIDTDTEKLEKIVLVKTKNKFIISTTTTKCKISEQHKDEAVARRRLKEILTAFGHGHNSEESAKLTELCKKAHFSIDND